MSVNTVRACAIFLGAFLIFQIQPIAGKHLLPFFGGAASVFTVALLFFSTMLFFGYAYVYILTRYPIEKQLRTHRMLTLITVTVAVLSFIFSFSLFSLTHFFSVSPLPPAVGVLATLVVSIALPYMTVATTSPLVLYWYGRTSTHEPYTLYALSNIASLLALVTYPFVMERYMNLLLHEILWLVMFVVYTVCMWILMEDVRVHAKNVHLVSTHARWRYLTCMRWVVLSAIPACLLVTTTTYITQVIAPVPLLWIVPLAVYLITFILAFRGKGGGLLNAVFILVLSYAGLHSIVYGGMHVLIQACTYLALLGAVGVFLHGLLYKERPDSESLPLFFLMLSLGGSVGSLLASLGAPLLLNHFHEFPIVLTVSAAVAITFLGKRYFRSEVSSNDILAVQGIIIFFFLLMLHSYVLAFKNSHALFVDRNFYGVVKVSENNEFRMLTNGITLHGAQYRVSTKQKLPTAYYTPESGIGQVLIYERKLRKDGQLRVGVIGLGVGTLASYCRTGDAFTFYEIDSRIVRIATSYFSFLSQCDGIQIAIGDGRILVQQELLKEDTQLDVLAIDAFSDDSIPTHLITQEAIHIFMQRVDSSSGIVAFHTSNRYLDLEPIIFRIAEESGYAVRLVEDRRNTQETSASNWVLIAHSEDVFVRSGIGEYHPVVHSIPVWTDAYTNVLPVMKFGTVDALTNFFKNYTF